MSTVENAGLLPAKLSVATQSKSDNPGGFAHVPALDGVRGAAILLVLFDHLFWSNGNTGNRLFDFISAVRQSSFVGVNLFFALSGFLITGILLDTLHIPHFFKTFYARRSLRIFPLYYGVLFFLLAITVPMHFRWNGWQYFLLTYTSNLGFWNRPDYQIGSFNIHHFWTLQVEEQFYFLWPLVVYRVRKLETLIRISLIGCVIVLLIRIGLVVSGMWPKDIYIVYSPTYSCVDNILLGCTLCMALRTKMHDTILRFAPHMLLFSVVIISPFAYMAGGLSWDKSAFFATVGFSLIGLCAVSIIAMSLKRRSLTQQFFETSFLRFFGKYSYGLYVYHYSIGGYLSGPLRYFVNQHVHSKTVSVLVAACITAGLSIVLALLSYHLYEAHFLKLKKYFSYGKQPA
jgi:peptidoglycan/LPS O-acetylase OafA/YrhL